MGLFHPGSGSERVPSLLVAKAGIALLKRPQVFFPEQRSEGGLQCCEANPPEQAEVMMSNARLWSGESLWRVWPTDVVDWKQSIEKNGNIQPNRRLKKFFPGQTQANRSNQEKPERLRSKSDQNALKGFLVPKSFGAQRDTDGHSVHRQRFTSAKSRSNLFGEDNSGCSPK